MLLISSIIVLHFVTVFCGERKFDMYSLYNPSWAELPATIHIFIFKPEKGECAVHPYDALERLTGC